MKDLKCLLNLGYNSVLLKLQFFMLEHLYKLTVQVTDNIQQKIMLTYFSNNIKFIQKGATEII